MLPYLADILWRAVKNTLSSYGHTWETIAITVIPMAVYWFRGRYRENRESGWRGLMRLPAGTRLKDVLTSLAVGLAMLGLVFVWNVWKSASERDEELQRERTSLQQKIIGLEQKSPVPKLLELSGEIDSFVRQRRAERIGIRESEISAFDIETSKRFEQNFWTRVVLWRERIGREYQEGELALNGPARNLDDMERMADALRALAQRVR